MNKLVTSWFVNLNPNGIYTLTFNTVNRWIDYHRFTNTSYIFADDETDEEDETAEENKKRMVEVPEFLPKIEGGQYQISSMQDKDQITFYFIPFYYSWIKEGEIKQLINSKTN